MEDSCCTCARLLKDVLPEYDEESEKPKTIPNERQLECCGRIICGDCISKNPRFATYCPFCQISTAPSPLPSQGLRDPPSYTPPSTSTSTPSRPTPTPPAYIHGPDVLPSYASLSSPPTIPSEKSPPAQDVLHFINHTTETLPGLSLLYNVPLPILRRVNNITADHLLQARRTIIIPGEYYKGGVSLSPRPVEGEEEERRKGIVRRWMVGCKVSEYDIALLYLEQHDYNLESAMAAYRDDERWEKEHPMEANITGKGKGKPRYDAGRRRFTGQRS